VEIAAYHLERLITIAADGQLEATIPVQAHLEGILFAFVAGADQTAEAINLVKKLQLKRPNVRKVLEAMPESRLRRQLDEW
jgi:hypothetical protein